MITSGVSSSALCTHRSLSELRSFSSTGTIRKAFSISISLHDEGGISIGCQRLTDQNLVERGTACLRWCIINYSEFRGHLVLPHHPMVWQVVGLVIITQQWVYNYFNYPPGHLIRANFFFQCWPYGQPVHDLVGHLIKLGGHKYILCCSLKAYSHRSGKTKNHRAHEVMLACQQKQWQNHRCKYGQPFWEMVGTLANMHGKWPMASSYF